MPSLEIIRIVLGIVKYFVITLRETKIIDL